jgi:SnoaL-like polyketide cyclase
VIRRYIFEKLFSMSTEANKLAMHRFTEFINTADEKLAEELIATHAVFHVPGRPEPMRGPAGYMSIVGMMRSGFSDIQWTQDQMVVEGERRDSLYEGLTTAFSSVFRQPAKRSR